MMSRTMNLKPKDFKHTAHDVTIVTTSTKSLIAHITPIDDSLVYHVTQPGHHVVIICHTFAEALEQYNKL